MELLPCPVSHAHTPQVLTSAEHKAVISAQATKALLFSCSMHTHGSELLTSYSSTVYSCRLLPVTNHEMKTTLPKSRIRGRKRKQTKKQCTVMQLGKHAPIHSQNERLKRRLLTRKDFI